jgi:hypothetical protein
MFNYFHVLHEIRVDFEDALIIAQKKLEHSWNMGVIHKFHDKWCGMSSFSAVRKISGNSKGYLPWIQSDLAFQIVFSRRPAHADPLLLFIKTEAGQGLSGRGAVLPFSLDVVNLARADWGRLKKKNKTKNK